MAATTTVGITPPGVPRRPMTLAEKILSRKMVTDARSGAHGVDSVAPGSAGFVRTDLRFAPPRMGDVRDSLADIRAARSAFGFDPRTPIVQGLAEYWAWFSRDGLTLKRLGIAT